MAKIVGSISRGQGHEILNQIEAASKAEGVNPEELASELIRENFFGNKIVELVRNRKPADDSKFGPSMGKFVITVPEDYQHEKQLANFTKRHQKEFYYFNTDITDKNFSKATVKLEPGKKYEVEIFPILRQVTSEENMAFLKKQNAILTGAQGSSLVYEQAKDKLPKGKWYLSFDEKDALWKDAHGYHRVPDLGARSDGDFGWGLGGFGGPWGERSRLLCFRDLSA